MRRQKGAQKTFEKEFTLRLGEIEPVGGLPLQRPGVKGVMALSLQGGCPHESVSESLLGISLRRETSPETMRTTDGSHQQP